MNISSGDVAETLKNIREIKGINFTDAITGPYDAIAKIEAADMDDLGRVVTTKILKVKGVAKTLTCVCV